LAFADDDLEGEGFSSPDHAALYDVSMDPEDRTAVFDLALSQDSDDGGLLDWDALAGQPSNLPSLSTHKQGQALPFPHPHALSNAR
jgi:hypothetical protein